jgi:hypothetical protein
VDMGAIKRCRARLTETYPVRKYRCQRGAEPGRHHLVIPGDIISERPGDFVGIRRAALPALQCQPEHDFEAHSVIKSPKFTPARREKA